jgi:uncharacterized protein (TIGR03118 family)
MAARIAPRRRCASNRAPQRPPVVRPRLEGLEDRLLLSTAFLTRNLVSNIPGLARVTDPNLVNPWGLTFNPTGAFWVSDNGTGLSTLYNGSGHPFPANDPLVVTIPPPSGVSDTAAPTGLVFSGSNDFMVKTNGVQGPSRFIFATEDGTISGWAPNVDFTHAILAVDNSASGAVYKGIALATGSTGNRLYAANFHSGKIDVFDSAFQPARLPTAAAFTDPQLPAGYAPFSIQNVAGRLVVTYAQQDGAMHDDVPGRGHGFIDVYNADGVLLQRLASRGALNSPWGMAVAPAGFGEFSGALLVGNFGDGHINAYDVASGQFLGQLQDAGGQPIAIPGLWGLSFGNGFNAGDPHTLFFNAGINDEQDGLFGSIQLAPGGRSTARASVLGTSTSVTATRTPVGLVHPPATPAAASRPVATPAAIDADGEVTHSARAAVPRLFAARALGSHGHPAAAPDVSLDAILGVR